MLMLLFDVAEQIAYHGKAGWEISVLGMAIVVKMKRIKHMHQDAISI
jgi:hypothetical protein